MLEWMGYSWLLVDGERIRMEWSPPLGSVADLSLLRHRQEWETEAIGLPAYGQARYINQASALHCPTQLSSTAVHKTPPGHLRPLELGEGAFGDPRPIASPG